MSAYKKSERDYYCSPYATIGTQRGRNKPLKDDCCRTDFQRDVHRIMYSQAFRRLRHKTQVFYFPLNDHVSTRMDHVYSVASAARTVARCLGLNEDLAEAIGLAHDIGHAPFGHQGEKILTDIIASNNGKLKNIMPSFEHEVYGLRVVDKIAKLDREVPGLNLTWEVRDGIISHCGEDFKNHRLEPSNEQKHLESIKTKKEAGNPATLEGCIVRLIDKIVYCGRDIEDALSANVITISQIPPTIKDLGGNNGQILGTFLEDVIRESYRKDYIALSQEKADLLHSMINFNYKNIYHSEKSEGYRDQAQCTLTLLFNTLLKKLQGTNRFMNSDGDIEGFHVYGILQQFVKKDMEKTYDSSDPDELIILDFLAGMTDSFAVRSFQQLFIPQATV
jgi:dGTPase